MSEHSNSPQSPSLLNSLRNFRYQSKPGLSHHALLNSSVSDEINSSCSSSPLIRKPKNLPVFIISDDSDDDVQIINYTRNNDNSDQDCVIISEISAPHTTPVVQSNSISEPTTSAPTKVDGSQGEDNTANDHQTLDGSNKGKVKRKSESNGNLRKKKKLDLVDGEADSDEEYDYNCVYNSDEEDTTEGVPKIKRKRAQVIQLLSEGSDSELCIIPHMTEKKLACIKSCRPYVSWKYTIEKFTNTPGLRPSMLNLVGNVIIARDLLTSVLKECEQHSSKNGKKILSKGTVISSQPALLTSTLQLTSYQLIGLNWLALMRSRNLNAILADEMGLGKTIQVIAFLAYLKETGLVEKGIPHLIVVPASTLNNWSNELERWCTSLKVSMYHGTQQDRQILRYTWVKDGFGDTEIVLTTYSSVTRSNHEKKLFRIKEFNYIIFDEAHMLKNMNSQRYTDLLRFNGNFKILLTGTPLQNNLMELMSLLIFLMPELFQNKESCIKLLFPKGNKNTDELNTKFEQERVEQAKRIIYPFMLRRLKSDVLRLLPNKTTEIITCPMLPEQSKAYNELLQEFKHDSETKNNYTVYFMMLRKMANHPLMLRKFFTEDKLGEMAKRLARDKNYKGTVVEYIQDDLYFLSDYELHNLCKTHKSLESLNYLLEIEEFCNTGKLKVLDRILPERKEAGHRVLIFSQFILVLDLLQEYLHLRGHLYLRMDGSTPVSERQELIDLFQQNENIFVFLLSTKAGGLGINLTAANTVIIHDIDYNPYNDKQAEDRCHRVGQTRTVEVIRLISENTVEEGMLKIAQNKLNLEQEVVSGNVDDAADTKTILQLLEDNLQLNGTVF